MTVRLPNPSGEPSGRGGLNGGVAPDGRDPCEGKGAGAPLREGVPAAPSDSAANGRGAVGRPHRVQLSRRSGDRMPPNTVIVSRPSEYGNPFKVPDELTGQDRIDATIDAIKKYRMWISVGGLSVGMIRRNLRGKNLGCWCALSAPCHADVLLEIANS